MASQHPEQVNATERRGARSPLSTLQTQNLDQNPRFSYMETPSQTSHPVIEQISSPTTTIEESPVSPGVQRSLYDTHAYEAPSESSYPIEKDLPDRTTSPYNFPPPREVHPAHFAPYADEYPAYAMRPSSPPHQMSRLSPRPQPPTAEEYKGAPDLKTQTIQPISGPDPDPMKELPNVDRKSRTPTYNPDSFAGPNVIAESHRPGQVSHPNSAIQPEWKHGLCEMDTTCCVGLFCPCMLYGKTQYRLSQKARKREATDLLGYENCNGSCAFMAVACGFQCMYYHRRISLRNSC